MSSLVLELQQEAMISHARVRDLLRKALVVASKLNISDFKEWAEQELHGYSSSSKIPEYRLIHGEIKVHNPFYGWQTMIFENHTTAEKLSQRYISQSIGEIENILDTDQENSLQVPLQVELLNTQRDSEYMQHGLIPTLIVSKASCYGITESVRNIILKWSLKLEQDGILGDGLTFSNDEKQKASSTTYHIQHLVGVAGNVQAENLQIGDYNTIHSELKRLGCAFGL
jgi:hypothetical protein